jgi:adenylosuccinate lyase
MTAIWSDHGRFQRWLAVEIAVCEVLAERGEIPAEALAEITMSSPF